MFGRMFQPKGLPSSYRRVAWLQSDGVAYINLDYEPIKWWGWNSTAEVITGTRFTIRAKYPSTGAIAPGTILGCKNSLTLATSFRWNCKIADSGTCQSQLDPTYSIYWTVNYSRDTTGVYSGTFTSPYGASYAIQSNGRCIYTDWDDVRGEYFTTDVTPTYPAQADDPNPTFDRPALSFPLKNWTATDTYTGTASQSFYTNAMTSMLVQGVKGMKMRVTVETAMNDVGSAGYSPSNSDDGTLFLFCKNSDGSPTSFDKNVKVDTLSIVEATGGTTLAVTFTTIRNLVACVRKRDEKPGMYDLKNHRFFTNAADTGEFLFAELTD